MDNLLVLLVPNAVGVAVVLLLLLPVVRRCDRRFAAARACLAEDSGLQHRYDVARVPGWRGRLLLGYLLLGAVLVLGGLVAQELVVQRVETRAEGAYLFLALYLLAVGIPLLLGAVLGARLVQQLVRGRARHRLLQEVLAEEPGHAGAAAAREELAAGAGSSGMAGVATAAVLACLAMGLVWVALLFVTASATIECARSSKCL